MRRWLAGVIAAVILVCVAYVAVGHWLGNPDNRARVFRLQFRGCVQQASRARESMLADELVGLGYHVVSTPTSRDLQGWNTATTGVQTVGGSFPYPAPTASPDSLERAATGARFQLGPGEQMYRRVCLEPSTADPYCGKEVMFMAIVNSAGEVRRLASRTGEYCE
jgi:hypothetical protein